VSGAAQFAAGSERLRVATNLRAISVAQPMASERNDHAEPAARVPAPVVVLDNVRRGIGLQSDRTKIVAPKPADSELALFQIAGNR
jgi:hypothetical protein